MEVTEPIPCSRISNAANQDRRRQKRLLVPRAPANPIIRRGSSLRDEISEGIVIVGIRPVQLSPGHGQGRVGVTEITLIGQISRG